MYTVKIIIKEGKPKKGYSPHGVHFKYKKGSEERETTETTIIGLDDNELDMFYKIIGIFKEI